MSTSLNQQIADELFPENQSTASQLKVDIYNRCPEIILGWMNIFTSLALGREMNIIIAAFILDIV